MIHSDEKYIREKLRVAVDCLAAGDAPIRDRLADAWVSALSRLDVDDAWTSDTSRDAFARARDTMMRHGTYDQSAKLLSDDEARDIATATVQLLVDAERSHT